MEDTAIADIVSGFPFLMLVPQLLLVATSFSGSVSHPVDGDLAEI